MEVTVSSSELYWTHPAVDSLAMLVLTIPLRKLFKDSESVMASL